MGKVTIKDIAREAGVSISTVSNALNGVDVLKPETRDHILEVADRLHYIPNLNGKNLKSKATKVIGLFATSLKGDFFSTLADIMYWEAMKYGYELNIFLSTRGKSAINNILGRRVDGCVVFSGDVDDEDAKQIKKFEVPTVFLDREIQGNKVSSVIFDSYKDGETVADFLLEKGVTKFGFIEGFVDHQDAIERKKGFMDRLAKAGIQVDPRYIWKGSFERDYTYKTTNAFLDQGLPLPEAIFACNDLSAFGCMDALTARGYQIPKDVMVVGVDDIELSSWYTPKLTTVKTGYEKIGIVAIRKLVKMINEEESGDITKLHGRLVERESTAKVIE